MSDIDTEGTVPEGQPAEGDAEVQADNEPSELEQKLADTETRLTDAEARADEYARALFEARVAATGRLADPTDLAYSADLLDDAEALTAAIDALLERKPHLASRRPAWGDVGAGQAQPGSGGPSWNDLFKG